ncbi:EthD family reductase [Nocardioides sp. GY 10127]|uniref:EthD family reductase n=1 Tax=Nocardioides sp. GY 10127 TaxID=2569762 RepID=UPI0010A7AF05|nr:EthD family reductase [Nocardioides sp. GY 10127]TIC82627.1 EthD family reductase [Nocardioides sp. GY 10127]
MATLTVLYGTPTDADAFRAHYEQVHAPLALALPGAKDPRWSLDVSTLAGETVHAIFQADFADADSLDAALASPEGQAAQADVPSFATGGVTILVS